MERKTKQVRRCSCATKPSLLASLSICLSAQLSVLNASCSTFICFYVHFFNLSTVVSIPVLSQTCPPFLAAGVFKLLPPPVLNPLSLFKAEPLPCPLKSCVLSFPRCTVRLQIFKWPSQLNEQKVMQDLWLAFYESSKHAPLQLCPSGEDLRCGSFTFHWWCMTVSLFTALLAGML